jgi:hypothetical protein
MPMGNEIHYAVTGLDNIKALMLKLGVQFLDDYEKPINTADITSLDGIYDMHSNDALIDINARLEAAYFAAASNLGWSYEGFGSYPYHNTHHYKTPFGLRRVSPFVLAFIYDPDEAGDDESMASLGVALSGRYTPTFLDIESAHGCLYNVDLQDALEKSKLAIDEIVKLIPELTGMKLILREIHY